ncbi:MAG: HD domain-containing protein [Alphaproteobacteria bacterium]|nr:HD domain-containing protein [Alphaproteobacteria bacterium]
MTPKELLRMSKCHRKAAELHKGVVYGAGANMFDQVTRTAALLHTTSSLAGRERTDAICAALLHKCFEKNRIAEGQKPLTQQEIIDLAGEKVAAVIDELRSEPPEKKNQTKTEQWQEKAAWAKTLSPAAREILLAEKIVNFETSRDDPNKQKALSWHIEYFKTRMLMVEAIKDTNPALYKEAVAVKDAGLKKLKAPVRKLGAELKLIAKIKNINVHGE